MSKPRKAEYSQVNGTDANSDESKSLKKGDEHFVSRMNRKMFDIESDSPSGAGFNLSDHFFEHIDRRTRFLLIPTFIIVGLLSFCIVIITLVGAMQILVGFIIIVSVTWLGSAVGMFGVYRWGSVEGCIQFFRRKNSEYEDELSSLSDIKGAVRQNAKDIYFSVGKLHSHGEELERNLAEFDRLRKELEKVCDKHEDLNRMLDEVNKQYEDMKELMYETEKSHLISIYFETSLRDDEQGLTKDEYQRFLMRLNKKTRREFELQGGFQAMDKDGNGVIDLNEFDHMVDMVREATEAEEMEFIKQRSTN